MMTGILQKRSLLCKCEGVTGEIKYIQRKLFQDHFYSAGKKSLVEL